MVGPDVGRVRSRVTIFALKTLTRVDRTLGWPCPIISSGASGYGIDCALTNFATVEDQCAVFKREHAAPIRGLGRSPRRGHVVEPNGSILWGRL
jgi:hypothetical protein